MARIKFHDRGDYCIGTIEVDTGAPGTLRIAAVGDDKADALARAASIAQRIVDDPIMRALMPPGAAPAIKAARMLGVAAKRGLPTLRRVWGKLRGPGKDRLVQALAQDAHAEVGLRNPFKRKKKRRKVPPIRMRPVEREEQPEPEEQPELEPVNTDEGEE